MAPFQSANNKPSDARLKEMSDFARNHVAGSLSTEPINRPILTEAVADYYKADGRAAPKIIFCRSPHEASTLAAVLSLLVKGNHKLPNWQKLDELCGFEWWKGTGALVAEQLDLSALTDTLSLEPKETVLSFSKSSSLSFHPQIRLQSSLNECLRSKMQTIFAIELQGLKLSGTLQAIDRTEMDAIGARLGLLRVQLRAHIAYDFERERTNQIIALLKKIWRFLPDLSRSTFAKDSPRYINQQPDQIWWGPLASTWMAPYLAVGEVLGLDRFSLQAQRYLALCKNLCSSSFACIFLDGLCIASERPNKIELDEEGRLHHASAAAMKFEDDYAIYSWHGANLPSFAILEPNSITPQRIIAERNVTVRRALIDRYGFSRFVFDAGAKEIHEDDFGVLYCIQIPGDEPLMLVKVVNATPEPDGSYKDYFLRVPPSMQTAKQAVAWTFGFTKDQYDLAFES